MHGVTIAADSAYFCCSIAGRQAQGKGENRKKEKPPLGMGNVGHMILRGKSTVLSLFAAFSARLIFSLGCMGGFPLIGFACDGKISVFASGKDWLVHTAGGKYKERKGKGGDVPERHIA
jgi:hypothetical protein